MAAFTPLTINGKTRRFRFDIRAGMAFEVDLGVGLTVLHQREQSLLALVKTLYYGFRWDDPKLKEADVLADLQLFLDGGGDLAEVQGAVIQALNESGVFGREKKPAKTEEPSAEGGAPASDPPTPTPVV